MLRLAAYAIGRDFLLMQCRYGVTRVSVQENMKTHAPFTSSYLPAYSHKEHLYIPHLNANAAPKNRKKINFAHAHIYNQPVSAPALWIMIQENVTHTSGVGVGGEVWSDGRISVRLSSHIFWYFVLIGCMNCTRHPQKLRYSEDDRQMPNSQDPSPIF